LKSLKGWVQWLTPVILATQEPEIRRITDRNQYGQIALKTLSQKTFLKNRSGGVVKMKALSSSLSTTKKNNNNS
jgi:hypothetical protein